MKLVLVLLILSNWSRSYNADYEANIVILIDIHNYYNKYIIK